MKCSRCGKRFRSLPAMSRHYRKAHPGAMKHRSHEGRKAFNKRYREGIAVNNAVPVRRFCPHCGGFLGD